MQAHQFIRYKAMDRCFRDSTHGYTIDELMDVCTIAIRNYHANPDIEPVGRRTIEKDLQTLQVYYGVQFNERNNRIGHKKIYRYTDIEFSLIKKLLDNGELEKMLLEGVLDTLALYDDVPQYKWLYMFLQQRANGIKADQTQAIEFQNNPDLMGMDHFSSLLDAIVNMQPLIFTYQKFGAEKPETNKIHPYQLKQFNDRWFLIARVDGYKTLSNYPLDRIVEFHPIVIPYVPADIDIDEYYDDVVGVTFNSQKPIEDVIIRVTNDCYPYIETKPLHSSQSLVHAMCDEKSKVIKLHVQINYEVTSRIMAYGNDVEVLAPESLRKDIRQKINDLANKYNQGIKDSNT